MNDGRGLAYAVGKAKAAAPAAAPIAARPRQDIDIARRHMLDGVDVCDCVGKGNSIPVENSKPPLERHARVECS